jgi:hypothetical protein
LRKRDALSAGKPDVPPLCVWRDVPSGAEVVLTYETTYGTPSTVFVLPNGVALAAAWQGDNTGPATSQQVAADFKQLQDKYPQAKILASTFDAFFKIANEPAIKAQLPVVTEEIGDGWLYGVPSDPLKNAQVDLRRHTSFCDAILYYQKRSFYQGRLGTNISR